MRVAGNLKELSGKNGKLAGRLRINQPRLELGKPGVPIYAPQIAMGILLLNG